MNDREDGGHIVGANGPAFLDVEEGLLIGAQRDFAWALAEVRRAVMRAWHLDWLARLFGASLDPQPRPKDTRCTDHDCYMAGVEHGPAGHI